MTRADGSRTYGYCYRVLSSGTGPRFIQCLCMLSEHPWYSLYANLLATAASRMADSFGDLEVFLKKLIVVCICNGDRAGREHGAGKDQGRMLCIESEPILLVPYARFVSSILYHLLMGQFF